MSESQPRPSSDDQKPRPERAAYADDESIDLGGLERDEDGASALSFSGRSGARTAGSSAVRSWEQVVQNAASESGILPASMPSADDIELATDSDLLREVLADDTPPSKIVLKDPTNGEIPAFRSESEPRSGKFDLPPELASTRASDSSILIPPPGSGGDLSSSNSDVFGSSSRVDLLGPHGATSSGSSSLQRTEKMAPSAVHSVHGNSSVLAHVGDGGIESSTVDLGSDSDRVEFPLQNGVASAAAPKRRVFVSPPAATRTRRVGPLTAGVGGLVLGAGLFAGLWWAGILPHETTKSLATANETGDLSARIHAAEQGRAAEAKKAAAAAAENQRLRQDRDRGVAAAAEAKRADDRARTLAEQVKKAETARNSLKAQIDRLTAARAADEARVRDADAGLTELRERLRSSEAEARSARRRADEAEAQRKQAAELAAEVGRRLQSASNSPPAVLAALDQALARAAEPPRDNAKEGEQAITTAQQAGQTFREGLTAYRSGRWQAAEQELARLAASSQADAVSLYYLGLAQWRQDQFGDAETSFRRGWRLERANRPAPAEVEAAFERCDRSERDLVNRYRR
jgi:hypothetical protein